MRTIYTFSVFLVVVLDATTDAMILPTGNQTHRAIGPLGVLNPTPGTHCTGNL